MHSVQKCFEFETHGFNHSALIFFYSTLYLSIILLCMGLICTQHSYFENMGLLPITVNVLGQYVLSNPYVRSGTFVQQARTAGVQCAAFAGAVCAS